MLAFNFTNFGQFIHSVSQPFHKVLASSFDTIKCHKTSSAKPPHPKNRVSVQSRSTDYTLIDEFRSKKHFQSHKQLQNQECFKEGANALKGWMEFKILMLQNGALRDIKEYVQQEVFKEDFSSIIASKKESVAQERFDLT